MENTNNKVYVNPNFNSSNASNIPCMPKTKVHINPYFSQKITQNPSRIYVNPNFVSSKILDTAYNDWDSISGAVNNQHTTKLTVAVDNNAEQVGLEPCLLPSTTKPKHESVSQYRYSLIRNVGNARSVSDKPITHKIATVKINKYKSVALKSYKNQLNSHKTLANSEIQSTLEKVSKKENAISKPKISQKYITSKYKLCKTSQVQTTRDTKLFNKSFSFDKKYTNSKLKTNRSTKINNIPCPLYRKYGKCLRKLNGTCSFSHDKKHVVICRNFLKGICHEKNCLLSHDITSKKMPTCHFYLKGLCTKENCSYLHVKLSDKTKVCPDFLKGYCEKGDLCLNRHVRARSVSYKLNKRQSLTNLNSPKVIRSKSINAYKLKSRREPEKNLPEPQTTETTSECRYYQDINVESNEADKLIQPSRCKLGVLPSFIKL